jgi:CxxC motif-containing protein (DUF1111 family)
MNLGIPKRIGPVATFVAGLLVVQTGCGGCGEPNKKPPKIATEIFAAMGEPVPHASGEQLDTFERGREVALARFSPETGLGPTYNVTFCASCHEQPTPGGSAPRYRNFVLTGTRLSDGSVILLGNGGVQAQFQTDAPYRVPTDESATFTSARNAIPFFGVGALAEVPESSILANADPDDDDGDGISGRPNYDRGFVGRFGRKAQTVSIEGFIRGPLFNHIGITSNPLSNAKKDALPVPSGLSDETRRDETGRDETMTVRSGSFDDLVGDGNLPFCPHCQAAAPEEPLVDTDGVPDPELSEDELFDLVSFSMLVAAPMPDELSDQGARGEALFADVGCASCHVPGLEGPRGLVMAYTDMLLHDMGDALDDGIAQGVATGSEFRTQPLWGVVATGPYLHDGRADTLDQAIRFHGGEAKAARDRYVGLSDAERAAVAEFLESLGGRAQRSDGLLPPEEPVAPVGAYGGPAEALTGPSAKLYERGRAIFDRDISLNAGLGPMFNGDSCRACHFEPTIGGAGPLGVNVTRQGIIDEETDTFFAPQGGTLLHRLTVDVHGRPTQHADANVIELRQTPPLYGLGLIDQIDDADIEANADPDDADSNGVSGRVARLVDGRIGRFGWKAAFPTLEDFVRDALSNENGLTLPENDEFIAGIASDTDAVADPEFSGDDYRALVFYSAMLGPPPSQESLDADEAEGQRLFGQVGCDQCHVPELSTSAGEQVRLFSDLLLHDVASQDFRGVEEAAAGMREFRTPPLWGISTSAPYMHDGLSSTLDQAIRSHASEAQAVVGRYELISDEERHMLLVFLETL